MPIIETQNLQPNGTYLGRRLKPDENLQVYNGLDCCLTTEIFEEVSSLGPAPAIYSFERAMQGPYLEIMQRGFLVDELSRRQAAEELRGKISYLQLLLDQLASAVWDKGLNPRSPQQLKDFFFSAMRLPEIWQSKKGQKKLSTDREALEKLHDYVYARPFVNCILAIRDFNKQLNVFESEIDPDGRYRTSYNIAGTETGRPSSSTNAYGTGGNAQNISSSLRFVFVADPGMRMCVIDLEQVEARDVGYFCGVLFDDWTFLDNCESGDLHTNNCKLVWPELGWTGDAKADRAIADRPFYRDFSYRDMSKRGGHLTNYFGTSWTMARSLKIPGAIAETFQARYCKGGKDPKGAPIAPAFPAIPRWWQWTAQQLQTTHQLTTPFGRTRHFFGRPGDDTTLREAIAFLPQSTTADRMNLGLWRVWKKFPQCQMLAQTYDSITFQYPETVDENELLPAVLKELEVTLVAPNGRKYFVPGEAKVGWNWGSQVTQQDIDRALARGARPPRLNLDGLIKWKPGMKESRVRAIGIKRRMV